MTEILTAFLVVAGAFLDVAIALALVAFLATVAFARFAERRQAHRDGEPNGEAADAPPEERRAR